MISFVKFATRRSASALVLDFADMVKRFDIVGKPSSEEDLEVGGVGRTADRRSRFFGRRREGNLVCERRKVGQEEDHKIMPFHTLSWGQEDLKGIGKYAAGGTC